MRNEETATSEDAEAAEDERTTADEGKAASAQPGLVILVADDDAVCVDDMCLPAEARP
jgi:hypothetical protein